MQRQAWLLLVHLLPVAFDGFQVDVRVPENVELQGFHFEFFVS